MFQEWSSFTGRNYPKDDEECLILLNNGQVWHVTFYNYTDDFDPPREFHSFVSFGPLGKAVFKWGVVAWTSFDSKSLKKTFEQL